MRLAIALVTCLAASPALALDGFDGGCRELAAPNARITEVTERLLELPVYSGEYCGLKQQQYQAALQIVGRGPAYAHCSQYRRAGRKVRLYERVSRPSCERRGH